MRGTRKESNYRAGWQQVCGFAKQHYYDEGAEKPCCGSVIKQLKKPVPNSTPNICKKCLKIFRQK